MYFEEVFAYINGAGVYQICLLFCSGAFFFLSFDVLSTNYIGGHMDHWCLLPALQNFSHDQQKYIGIPDSHAQSRQQVQLPTDLEYRSCHRFPLDFGNYTQEELLRWNRTKMTGSIAEEDWVKCDHGWVYDKGEFLSTIGSEVNTFFDHFERQQHKNLFSFSTDLLCVVQDYNFSSLHMLPDFVKMNNPR